MRRSVLFAATSLVLTVAFLTLSPMAFAEDTVAQCLGLPSHNQLKSALSAVVAAHTAGGLNLNMWATVVNRDGIVCAVAFTGGNRGDQWPGSRVISAQKANTANAFSLPGLSLSTANLYTAVQPGGTLFGLQESNPVDTSVAYGGNSNLYGLPSDPMVGEKIGGVNVFGGGLALYNAQHHIIGAIGVSGDTSCADHIIAWRTRHSLVLDYVPAGVATGAAPDVNGIDNAIFDIHLNATGHPVSTSGFGHPECSAASTTASNALPTTDPVRH